MCARNDNYYNVTATLYSALQFDVSSATFLLQDQISVTVKAIFTTKC